MEAILVVGSKPGISRLLFKEMLFVVNDAGKMYFVSKVVHIAMRIQKYLRDLHRYKA